MSTHNIGRIPLNVLDKGITLKFLEDGRRKYTIKTYKPIKYFFEKFMELVNDFSSTFKEEITDEMDYCK